jgi:putative ABC transport system permease protein
MHPNAGTPADPGLRRASVALRNLRRSPFRSFAIGAAMALMSGSLLAIAATLQVVQSGVARGAAKLGADILVVRREAPSTPDPDATPLLLDYSTVAKVREVEVIVPQYGGRPPKRLPGVAAASAQLSLWLHDLPWADGNPVHVTGFEPDTDLTVQAWLPQGLSKPLGRRDALVGHYWAGLADRNIELSETRFTVRGVLDRTGTQEMDRSIFVPLPAAWQLARRTGTSSGTISRPITRVMVRSSPTVETQRAANFIRSSVRDVDPRLRHKGLTALGAQLRLSVGNLMLIAGAIWVTVLLLVGTASSMVIRERQRELGLLRAMGATRRGLMEMLAIEILTVCLAGGVIGVGIALGSLVTMGDVARDVFGSTWTWPPAGQMVALEISCVIMAPATGLLAALAPTLRAVRLEPHAAIQDAL